MNERSAYPKPPPLPPRGGDDAVSVLIPYKNPCALTAYYLAIFSLIPCLGMVLGGAALVLGIIGLRYAREHEDARGRVHAWVGIIMGGLIFLVHAGAIIAYAVALIVLPRTT